MIAAAGSGQRLGASGPKAFVELAGVTLLGRALAAVAGADLIWGAVIAAPAGHEELARAELDAVAGLGGVVVAGGESRAESVQLALQSVETDLALVHDAARPLAPPALFDAIVLRFAGVPEADAVIAATPVVDTVKRSTRPHDELGPGRVAATVARTDLWQAQTPQGFRTESLRAAQRQALERGSLAAATDEAALIEAAGGEVLLERAPAENLKVTDAADLRRAAALLAAGR